MSVLKKIAFTVGLVALAAGNLQAQKKDFKLQNGDLLFQDLDCGPLCNAIEQVTQGHNSSTFSHVGIVQTLPGGDVLVLEAIGDSVQLTPLAKFLSRTSDKNGKPKVAVGRLRQPYRHLISPAIEAAQKYRGKPYDAEFSITNDSYYCSEIIYFAFEEANKKPLFELQPMTYRHPKTKQVFTPWENHFKELNVKVPEGDPGLNPGGMSRSKVLKMYYPFGQPDKLK